MKDQSESSREFLDRWEKAFMDLMARRDDLQCFRNRSRALLGHKTANILDKMPKSVQGTAKQLIHEMCLAPTRKVALAAYDQFIQLPNQIAQTLELPKQFTPGLGAFAIAVDRR
jgi:hypothetical protein